MCDQQMLELCQWVTNYIPNCRPNNADNIQIIRTGRDGVRKLSYSFFTPCFVYLPTVFRILQYLIVSFLGDRPLFFDVENIHWIKYFPQFEYVFNQFLIYNCLPQRPWTGSLEELEVEFYEDKKPDTTWRKLFYKNQQLCPIEKLNFNVPFFPV